MTKVWDVIGRHNMELGPVSASTTSAWRHWKLARDEGGIAWLVLDKQGSSANTLSEEVLTELNDVLAALEQASPTGLVIRSAKPAGFIAGADIGEFRGMTDVAEIETRLARAHTVVDRLATLKMSDRGGGARLLPGWRPRSRARLQVPDRGRRRAVRISRSDAWPASRPRRHGARAAPDQSDRSHDHDADRPYAARGPRPVARPGRRGDAGASCAGGGE